MKKFLLSLAVLLSGFAVASADTWTQVKSVDDIDFTGEQEYVIVSGNNAIMGYNIGSNSYLPKETLATSNFNTDGDIKELPSGAAIVKISGTTSAAKLQIFDQTGTSKGYYTTSAAKKCSLDTTGINASISVTSTYNFEASFGSYGKLYYNSQSPRFLNYTSAQTAVQLYKKVTAVEDGRTKVTLTFPEAEYTLASNATFDAPAVSADVEAALTDVVYSSSNTNVAEVSANGSVTIKGLGQTTILAQIKDSENYYDAEASYILNVFDPYETTLKFSELGYNATRNLDDKYTLGFITFEFDQAGGGTIPAYNNNDAGARIYGGNTVTISVEEGYFISSAAFLDNKDAQVTFITGVKVTNGTLTNSTWTPKDKRQTTFTLTNGGTSGNTKVDHITVKIVSAEEVGAEDFTFDGFKDYIIEADEVVELGLPESAPEITFTSTDEDVAMVEDGAIYAMGVGEATVTATWDESVLWHAGTAEFKVTVVSALINSKLSVEEPSMLASLGEDLVVPFTYEGAEETEFTVVSSKEDVATAVIGADGKTVVVTPKDYGKTTFTLTAAATTEYNASEVKFTVEVAYADLASVLEDAVQGETYTGNFPLIVVYDNDLYNYVTDENRTAWALFYVDHHHGDGAVIPAGWNATYTVYNGLPEFNSIKHADESEFGDPVDFELDAYNNASITKEMVNHVCILNDVEVEEATPDNKATFAISYGDSHYACYNAFTLPSVEPGFYNVKVVISVNTSKSNNDLQIWPIEFYEMNTTTAPKHVDAELQEGDKIEFTGLEDGAVIYYRHGGENPDHTNVFTDTTPADAPRKAVADVNTEWTYNHTTHPLTYQGQPMTVKYYAKAPGKAPSAVGELNVDENGSTTGIEAIAVDAAKGEVEYYNLQGQRIAAPAAGLYIMRQGTEVKKVLVK